MKEEEIYIATKAWFKKKDYLILGGQPPGGTDHIPLIEIKDPNYSEKGSKGSYKPDLIVGNKENIIIIECKPDYDLGDEKKLKEIINSDERKIMLFKELQQRHLLKNDLIKNYDLNEENFKSDLRYCLSHAGETMALDSIATLRVKSVEGEGILIQPKISKYTIVH
jgi:hypothetical protein